ncbi:hypothetical protein Droror1_Dr00017431 [Drosera rotundifolia]
MASSSSPSSFNPEILKGKVTLITSDGSGIGFEISSQFGKHGASIAIMTRRKQMLDSTAYSGAHQRKAGAASSSSSSSVHRDSIMRAK